MKVLIAVVAVLVCQALAAPIEENVSVAAEPVGAVEEPVVPRDQRSAPYAAPYAAPSYAAPAYAPIKAGPAKSYSYPSPAPSVPCGTNLIFGCSPNVAPVPCQASPSYGPSYGAPAYGGY